MKTSTLLLITILPIELMTLLLFFLSYNWNYDDGIIFWNNYVDFRKIYKKR